MDLAEYGLSFFCKQYGVTVKGDYTIEWVDAKELVIPERLDLISKIIYVDYYLNKREGQFATELYKRDLEICTLGTYSEFGNDEKNSFVDYCHAFNSLIDDIKQRGFSEYSVVPVDANGIIMDGAHRTAIAAYLGLRVPIIRFKLNGPSMGADLYIQRMARREDIEFALTEMCKWNNDLFLCCMWPAAEGSDKRDRAVNILKNDATLLYRKTLQITTNALSNIIPQIYITKDWVGSIEDRFITASSKIEGCIGKDNLDVLLFRADDLEHVKSIKQKMRDVFGIYENSLHITDYPDETLFIAQMLLSDNTVAFLNKATPFYFVKLNKRIAKYKEIISNSDTDINEYIIDSSTIMGLYGIREPDDLDYLYAGNNEALFKDSKISNHREELKYHCETVHDLIFNPVNYLYYAGVKVITLQTLLNFKTNRNTAKDRADITLISSYLENKHKFKQTIIVIYQTIRRKFRNMAYIILRKLPWGGYEKVRSLYHFMKGR